MALILVCHGAWSGGWSWKRVRAPLKTLGHELLTPTYTGLGERSHLGNPMIDLKLHIRDIRNVIEYEDLGGVVLLGHSYGGMVATGVADEVAERIGQIVYLDAFVPESGQSVLDLNPANAAAAMRHRAATEGDSWFLPAPALPPDMPEAEKAWLMPRRGRQPLKTFEQRLTLSGNGDRLPRSYIYCRAKSGDDPFAAIAARVRVLPGWRYFEMDWGHTPNLSQPEALAALLDTIVAGH